MNKYILDEKIGMTYNASSKARDDVAYFVSTYRDSYNGGYKLLGCNDKTQANSKIEKALIGLKSLFEVFVKIKKNDILFVQSSFSILKILNIMKKVKPFKTIYLIHDIDSLRDAYEDDKANSESVHILNQQDVLICHNQKMISELERRGCNIKKVSLEIFDYSFDVNDQEYKRNFYKKRVCFAGNLNPNKTGFLYKLDNNPPSTYSINVYGKKEKEFKNLNYCGCYPPEDLPKKIIAEFGLIWEGDYYTYDESEHPYIMFNNPHKASLYTISKLPIIVWKKAAIADLVLQEGIGVVIDSIQDIDRIMQDITAEDYALMQNNINKFRRKLINGEHIHAALSMAESFIL